MKAFEAARNVEDLAWQRLKPYIQEITDGRFVLVNKGPHAKRLQEELGDVLANLRPTDSELSDPFSQGGRFVVIELKAERRDSKNLFLETWSNRNLKDAASHAERGSNPGWLFKIRADLLLYYFIDTDKLCVVNVLALKRWAFRTAQPSSPWPLLQFAEKQQNRYEQKNDTWGVCVPIEHLALALGGRSFKVTSAQQLALFESWEGGNAA